MCDSRVLSPAFRGLGCGVERIKRGVESSLAAPTGLMVGLGGEGIDQCVEVAVSAGENDASVLANADAENQSFTVGTEQVPLTQGCRHLVADDDLADGAHDGEPSAAQIERRISQLLITRSSPQTLHCHRTGVPNSCSSTIIRPWQRRWAGRRRQGSALFHAVPTSPAVAARTMLLWCSASRRAGPGASSDRSRKCRRSVTNTLGTVPRSTCTIGAAAYRKRLESSAGAAVSH